MFRFIAGDYFYGLAYHYANGGCGGALVGENLAVVEAVEYDVGILPVCLVNSLEFTFNRNAFCGTIYGGDSLWCCF